MYAYTYYLIAFGILAIYGGAIGTVALLSRKLFIKIHIWSAFESCSTVLSLWKAKNLHIYLNSFFHFVLQTSGFSMRRAIRDDHSDMVYGENSYKRKENSTFRCVSILGILKQTWLLYEKRVYWVFWF